uniref:Uncharacterized protein n=1 Tax=Phthorimaea operculella granulovirus TaxID=192584 RepID=A0A481SDG7_9BBAC|nr:hypothetical protein PhopGVgp028 [Phthorimaea operculella granulovirus]
MADEQYFNVDQLIENAVNSISSNEGGGGGGNMHQVTDIIYNNYDEQLYNFSDHEQLKPQQTQDLCKLFNDINFLQKENREQLEQIEWLQNQHKDNLAQIQFIQNQKVSQIDQLNKDIENLTQDNNKLKLENESLQKKIEKIDIRQKCLNDYENHIKSMQNQFDEQTKEMQNNFDVEKKKLQKQFDQEKKKLQRQLEKKKQDSSSEHNEEEYAKKLEEECANKIKTLEEECANKIKTLEDKIQEYENKIKIMEEEHKKQIKTMIQNERELQQSHEEKVERLTDELKDVHAELDYIKKNTKNDDEQIKLCKTCRNSNIFKQKNIELDKLRTTIEKKEKLVKELQEKIQELEKFQELNKTQAEKITIQYSPTPEEEQDIENETEENDETEENVDDIEMIEERIEDLEDAPLTEEELKSIQNENAIRQYQKLRLHIRKYDQRIIKKRKMCEELDDVLKKKYARNEEFPFEDIIQKNFAQMKQDFLSKLSSQQRSENVTLRGKLISYQRRVLTLKQLLNELTNKYTKAKKQLDKYFKKSSY